jgi:hypothetical protein
MAKASGQLSAAIRAEELRGKLQRFYVDQVETGGAHEFDQMTEDELRQYIVEEAKALGLHADLMKPSGAKH